MKTLEDLYNEYLKDWYNTHNEGEPVCYSDWLYNEFAEAINENLSEYEKCCIYNEYADYTGHTMWDDIDSLNEFGKFTDLYSKIRHENFNILDDIIIEENGYIVSYTYADFIGEYWNIDAIVKFIDNQGVETLINADLILDNV